MGSIAKWSFDRKVSVSVLVTVVVGGLGTGAVFIERVTRLESNVAHLSSTVVQAAAEAKETADAARAASIEAKEALWGLSTVVKAVERIERNVDWLRNRAERAGQ